MKHQRSTNSAMFICNNLYSFSFHHCKPFIHLKDQQTPFLMPSRNRNPTKSHKKHPNIIQTNFYNSKSHILNPKQDPIFEIITNPNLLTLTFAPTFILTKIEQSYPIDHLENTSV